MTARARILVVAALYFLSVCVLSFEVALSRVLAATTGYHMAFLAVSLTIFGLGCGGFGLFWLRRRGSGWARGDSPALWAALLLPLSLINFVILSVYSSMAESWTPFMLTTLLPFLFAGVVISHLFREYAKHASFLYAFDLLGAAMGCLVVVLLLHFLGGGLKAILFVALLASGPLLLLVLLSEAGKGWYLAAAGVTTFSAAVLIVALTTTALDLNPFEFQGMREYIASQSEAGNEPQWQPELSSWDEYSRVDVVHYTGAKRPFKHIFINGRTPANMVGFSGQSKDVDWLPHQPGFMAFMAGDTKKVCCIGAGGGLDILVSLVGGAKHIDAVEINPGVVRATLDDGGYNGNLFRMDAVELFVEDGRSFLARHPDKRYDVIYLSLVQSITGDFNDLAFVEDYLYTVEATGSYFDRLNEGGRAVMETHHLRLLYRYLATLAQMLENKGVAKEKIPSYIGAFAMPKDDIHTAYVALLFAEPPRPDVVAAVARHTKAMGGEILHLAGVAADPVLTRFINGDGALVIGESDVSPCTDDRPFFFRHSPTFVALMVKIWGAVLLANLLLVALLWWGRRKLPTDGKPAGLGVMIAYFMLIGVNYTLVQIVIMQKSILFLGYPTLSLSVVLFTMLVGSGLGAFVSKRFDDRLLEHAKLVLAVVAVLGLGYAFGLGPLYRSLIDQSIGLKMLIVVVLLLPISFLLGMPMPLGLRASEARFSEGIPYFWGLNGTASVLGSLTATVIALSRGFTAAWLVAALLTLILVLVLHRLGDSVNPAAPGE